MIPLFSKGQKTFLLEVKSKVLKAATEPPGGKALEKLEVGDQGVIGMSGQVDQLTGLQCSGS